MKLLSMTDFVLEQANQKVKKSEAVGELAEIADNCIKYAKFLKQPLKLEMFVPRDEEGNVLEEPPKVTYFDPTEPVPEDVEQEYFDYDKAKEKVLFEGWELKTDIELENKDKCFMISNGTKNMFFNNIQEYGANIEHLAMNNWDVLLTPSALKQIGLQPSTNNN